MTGDISVNRDFGRPQQLPRAHGLKRTRDRRGDHWKVGGAVISWRGFWALAATVFFSSLIPRVALAAANDAAAAKLREAAIYQDYLATDFASAEKKLSQAIALCEKPADCTA